MGFLTIPGFSGWLPVRSGQSSPFWVGETEVICRIHTAWDPVFFAEFFLNHCPFGKSWFSQNYILKHVNSLIQACMNFMRRKDEGDQSMRVPWSKTGSQLYLLHLQHTRHLDYLMPRLSEGAKVSLLFSREVNVNSGFLIYHALEVNAWGALLPNFYDYTSPSASKWGPQGEKRNRAKKATRSWKEQRLESLTSLPRA